MRRISTESNPDSKAAKKRQLKADRKAAAKQGISISHIGAQYYPVQTVQPPPIPQYYSVYSADNIVSIVNDSTDHSSMDIDVDDVSYNHSTSTDKKSTPVMQTGYKIPARIQDKMEFAWIVESAGVTQLVASTSRQCQPSNFLVEYLVWSAEDFINAVASSIIPAPTVSTVTYKYIQNKNKDTLPEYYTCIIGAHKVHIDKIARVETQRIDEEMAELEEELRELRNLRTLIDYSHCVECVDVE